MSNTIGRGSVDGGNIKGFDFEDPPSLRFGTPVGQEVPILSPEEEWHKRERESSERGQPFGMLNSGHRGGVDSGGNQSGNGVGGMSSVDMRLMQLLQGGGRGGGGNPMAMLQGLSGGGGNPMAMLQGLSGGGGNPMAMLQGLSGGGGNPMAMLQGLSGGGGNPMAMLQGLSGGGMGGGGNPMAMLQGLSGGRMGGGGTSRTMLGEQGVGGQGTGGGGGGMPGGLESTPEFAGLAELNEEDRKAAMEAMLGPEMMAQMNQQGGLQALGGLDGQGLQFSQGDQGHGSPRMMGDRMGLGQSMHDPEGSASGSLALPPPPQPSESGDKDFAQRLINKVRAEASQCTDAIAQGMNTILILDTSKSMKHEPIQEAIDTIENFICGLEDNAMENGIEENIALIVFGQETKVLQHYTNEYTKIRDAMDDIICAGDSCVREALIMTLGMLDRGGAININGHEVNSRIVILSDGQLTIDGAPPTGDDRPQVGAAFMVRQQTVGIAQQIGKFSGMKITFVPVGEAKSEILVSAAHITGGEMCLAGDIGWLSRAYLHHTIAGYVMGETEGKPADKDVVESLVRQKYKDLSDLDMNAVLVLLKLQPPETSGLCKMLNDSEEQLVGGATSRSNTEVKPIGSLPAGLLSNSASRAPRTDVTTTSSPGSGLFPKAMTKFTGDNITGPNPVQNITTDNIPNVTPTQQNIPPPSNIVTSQKIQLNIPTQQNDILGQNQASNITNNITSTPMSKFKCDDNLKHDGSQSKIPESNITSPMSKLDINDHFQPGGAASGLQNIQSTASSSQEVDTEKKVTENGAEGEKPKTPRRKRKVEKYITEYGVRPDGTIDLEELNAEIQRRCIANFNKINLDDIFGGPVKDEERLPLPFQLEDYVDEITDEEVDKLMEDFGGGPPKKDNLPIMPDVGLRVKPGPDWMWSCNNVCLEEIGTVVSIDEVDLGWVHVHWDNDVDEDYRFGLDYEFDIEPAEGGMKCVKWPPGKARIIKTQEELAEEFGLAQLRKRMNEDLVEKHGPAEDEEIAQYNEEMAKKETESLDISDEEMEDDENTTIGLLKKAQRERGLLPPIVAKCYIWQYQDDQGDWQNYPSEIRIKLENEYKKRSGQASCIIQLDGANERVIFNTMEQRSVENKKKSRRKVRRKEVDADTLKELDEMSSKKPDPRSQKRFQKQ